MQALLAPVDQCAYFVAIDFTLQKLCHGAYQCSRHCRSAAHAAGNGDGGGDGDGDIGDGEVPFGQQIADQIKQGIAVDAQLATAGQIGAVNDTALPVGGRHNLYLGADVGHRHGNGGPAIDDGMLTGND